MKLETFGEFYAYYLTQHADPTCRTLHFIGSTLVLCTLGWVLATQTWWGLVLLPLIGYGFAWVGHFAFEKNKPASFGHPFYSFASDWVMWFQMLTGKVPFSGRLQTTAA
ncbi:DUF962 domain-containing protein [Ramlibacter sp. PS4R-6]|uniref:DUF962 domain-containing protein n=1 Tax=Ramlibacter sp. PS4R-6 TaxID=3133438 RepID=UPI0030AC25F4